MFNSLTIIGFSIGFSTSLPTCELGSTTLNVNDWIYCLTFGKLCAKRIKNLS